MPTGVEVQTGGHSRFRGINAVLFDLDRTLIHLRGAKVSQVLSQASRGAHAWLVREARPAPAESLYIRRIRWALIKAILWSQLVRREVDLLRVLQKCHRRMRLDWQPEDGAQLAMQFAAVFRRFYTPDEQAGPVLQTLQQAGLRLGLVSNTMLPAIVVDDHLRASGLLDFLPVRVLSSESHYMKPDPRIFQIALDRLGVMAKQSMFVGDRTETDIAGASRIGMATVLLVHGKSPGRGSRRADVVVRSLAEIPALLAVRESAGATGAVATGPTMAGLPRAVDVG